MFKLGRILFLAIQTMCFIRLVESQSYENVRCNCICTVFDNAQILKKQYIASVPPDNDCDSIVLPRTNGSQGDNSLCPLCQCKYESRNTTTIKVVVIIVVWVISLLLIYMMILICLDPFLNNRLRKDNYVEQTNEEVCSLLDDYYGERHFDESPNANANLSRVFSQFSTGSGASTSVAADSGSSINVLNRVSHHQDKWIRQVREQRKNIYDRHTMLN